MGDADLEVGEALEIAVEDQVPDRERRFQRMTDRVREIMVAHAADEARSRRVQEDQHTKLFRPGKEFFQTGARQIDAAYVGAELDAAEAERFHRALQLGDRHAAILQRHGAHAHQPIRMLCDQRRDVSLTMRALSRATSGGAA